MSLSNVALISYGRIEDFFKAIKKGQAPEKFTSQHLKDIGFTSSNDRSFIQLLKSLDFLTEDGMPTQRYHDYRNDAISKQILGQAVAEAYSDIFVLRSEPKPEDEEIIQGKFKSAFNTSDTTANRLMKTFFGLYNISDFKKSKISNENKSQEREVKKDNIPHENVPAKKNSQSKSSLPSLNYNIQIHLPATKDVEVYNAIFKSLKEHLID